MTRWRPISCRPISSVSASSSDEWRLSSKKSASVSTNAVLPVPSGPHALTHLEWWRSRNCGSKAGAFAIPLATQYDVRRVAADGATGCAGKYVTVMLYISLFL